MLHDLWPIEPIRHLGIDLRFLKHKKVEDFKREAKIKKLMRKQLGDSSIWKNKTKYYKDRRTGEFKKDEGENDYFFNDNSDNLKGELPAPKLESWKFENKDRPQNDPKARTYKSEIVKIQREIARERHNESNNQLDLLNFYNHKEKPSGLPKPKLEGDALEKLWRPNIKREHMHRTGEVRIKYDTFQAEEKDSDVDAEFLEEYKEEFSPVKSEWKQSSAFPMKSEGKSEYFGGLVKLEKTKEEQAHLGFIEKIKEEEWREQRMREIYGDQGIVDIEERSEFEEEEKDENVVVGGEKYKRIDDMFKKGIKGEVKGEQRNDEIEIEEEWWNEGEEFEMELDIERDQEERKLIEADKGEDAEEFLNDVWEDDILLEVLTQKYEMKPWDIADFKEDLKYFNKHRRLSL